MIVGNGDIAKVLPNKRNLLFFASGVSNSQEKRESEYQRERQLLLRMDMTKHIVYFSSLAVFYSNKRYAKHKRTMETRIKELFPQYTIIRLGNITWGENPNTLINFIRNKVETGDDFEIQDVYRYIIDKQEFLHWINLIPDWSCEMNLTGHRMKVLDIVKKYGNT